MDVWHFQIFWVRTPKINENSYMYANIYNKLVNSTRRESKLYEPYVLYNTFVFFLL